jgi:hypothetical protein
MRGDCLQAAPGFGAIGGVLVLDAELVQHFGDLAPGDQRIVGEENRQTSPSIAAGGISTMIASPKCIGENLFDVEDGHQLAVIEFGDRRDQPLVAGENAFRRRTRSQSTRMMRSTSCTRKPSVRLLYSATIIVLP